MYTRGRGRTSWHPVLSLLLHKRKGPMGFIVRSLGGKLIVIAAFILLLSMLLFVFVSWLLLVSYSEHEARSAAQNHLFQVEQTYQVSTSALQDELHRTSTNTTLLSDLSTTSTQATQDHLQSLLVPAFTHNHLSILALVSRNHQLLAQLTNTDMTSQEI